MTIRILTGDCREVMATMEPDSVDACVTDPPYLLEFMGQSWDRPDAAPVGLSTFDAWFAGFCAGEACFRTQGHKGGSYYTCSVGIHLRDDDAAVLLGIQKRLGGRIARGAARTNAQGVNSSPDIRLIFETRESCWAVASILDRVPLFAKKAQDYALWRRALQLWTDTPKGSRWHGARDVSEMAAIHAQLQTVKRYSGDVDLDFDPFQPSMQAFHYRWAREVYRVLKPGAWLLACSGTRTQHRMVCAIEDAGFEIRDQIGWAYGFGFPKSLDVSKAIDKAAGAEREVVGRKTGRSATPVQNIRGGSFAGGNGVNGGADCSAITVPATPEAAAWQGWGTALKPAWEPICVARKPIVGTVAGNVLAHGTGALNIDGCRVETDGRPLREKKIGDQDVDGKTCFGDGLSPGSMAVGSTDLGRWPANLIHDGSDEVLACFPDAPGQSGVVTGAEPSSKTCNVFGLYNERATASPRGDTGSAGRFFYTAKASRSERGDGNGHPTVKPVDLMRWLVRLVTPPGGHVLDPFAGSGTTGIAANIEQMQATLIELSPDYAALAARRIREDGGLFAEVAAE